MSSPDPPTRPAPADGLRRLTRATRGRLVAGVAQGVADHLRVPVLPVRLLFVVLACVGGFGALLYAGYWAVVPPDAAERPSRTRRDALQLVAFAMFALGLQVVAVLAGAGGLSSPLGWLVALVAVGAGIIWHQAEPERRQHWATVVPGMPHVARWLSAGQPYGSAVRIGAGVVLVLVGVVGMVAVFSPLPGAGLSALLNGLLFTVVALGGLAVVAGPLLLGMVKQLRAEREARIRETERAEMAALIHDEVLHTLALIQRGAGDRQEVARLARAQERRLRNWLYGRTGSPGERFAAALEQAAAEVENAFAVTVDVVVVGDRPVDERVAALVAASREALVNAARHSGVRTVSLYAEVEPGTLTVFVRDRGAGFDPAAVHPDRHGVRGSIRGRMERHGGRTEIRTAPGEGTEVGLFLPLTSEGERV